MNGHLLTDEERKRFVTYLEQSADSSELMIKQLSGLLHAQSVARMLELEIRAYRFVAKKLKEVESYTITKSETAGPVAP